VALAGGMVVLLSVVNYFSGVFSVISSIAQKAGLATSVITLLFKVIAIGYITEFSSSLIDDMGLSSLSDKVTLAGKLIIVAVSLPVVVQLFNFIAGLLS
ncbi:MAG: stage III sporulation AC/AD family protein, partial [Clostridiales bacterium]|nr:stage III sporulation AC/AD family protein [Clostridiales bacterium]